MSDSPIFTLAYQVCPIILTGQGLAASTDGGPIPILDILNSGSFSGSGDVISPDDYFASFVPLPGATIIDQDVAMYPFANLAVAANAVITKPLTVSILMICPVREPGGYAQKSAIMQALQSSLYQHNTTGGTYTVATPSFVYTDCLMVSMRSQDNGESKQVQSLWQMDFVKPLLTIESVTQVQNSLMKRMTNQTKIEGPPSWSGLPPTTGKTQSGIGPALIVPQKSTTSVIRQF